MEVKTARGATVNIIAQSARGVKNMLVKTRDFGEMEIEDTNVITFPNGVYAFEDVRRFALLSPLGENTFPMWLQCLDDSELCFIVFNPSEIASDYTVSFDRSGFEAIDADYGGEVSYLCIAVVPEDYTKTTVNLKSPIILNADKRLAAQVIAYENYGVKHPVFLSGVSN
jgi:flagellar assembly factor FliW